MDRSFDLALNLSPFLCLPFVTRPGQSRRPEVENSTTLPENNHDRGMVPLLKTFPISPTNLRLAKIEIGIVGLRAIIHGVTALE